MAKDLLLEIGTEEIPAGYIPPALNQMQEKIKFFLDEERIGTGEISTYGTPRRLTLYIKDVNESASDLETEILGPHKKAAFDEDGKPTKAAIGFARSQGVGVEDLKIKETKKGEYVYAIKKVEGKATSLALKTLLPGFIISLSFPKSMRWGSTDLSFARPIRWILTLFGKDVIDFELDGLRSEKITYGHRFLAPGPIEISNPSEYMGKLEKAYVLVEGKRRKELIQKELVRVAKEGGGSPLKDDKLIDEVTYLVEYSVVIGGTFNQRYLKLPPEVLIAAMCEHQRYFPVEDNEGNLLNSFLVVSNGPEKAKKIIRQGNERVLLARLEDASFFFDQDMKIPIESRVEDEKGRIFHEKLGTIYEKTQRLVELAKILACRIDPELEEKARRAAWLCKADLSTEMVGEFPKLQGIMGCHYALRQGEDDEVARAIQEHYLPRFADDQLPKTRTGVVVSLADKLDSIVALFTVGLVPTGSEDPYGLRRQAQGMINIILENSLSLSLRDLIEDSVNLLDKGEKAMGEIGAFFGQRITVALTNRDIADDEIEAVFKVGFDNPLNALHRAMALKQVRGGEDFEHLAVAFKRTMNILNKKGEGSREQGVREELFEEETEKLLYQTYLEIKEKVVHQIEKKDYIQALTILATLREPVDKFFDDVLVMAEDGGLRENRLALLSCIAQLFLRIADISYLRIGEKGTLAN